MLIWWPAWVAALRSASAASWPCATRCGQAMMARMVDMVNLLFVCAGSAYVWYASAYSVMRLTWMRSASWQTS
ncbi:hypothetical protein D3C85_1671250 [compost metagenome]